MHTLVASLLLDTKRMTCASPSIQIPSSMTVLSMIYSFVWPDSGEPF